MSHGLILNGHQPHPSSKGALNAAMAARIAAFVTGQGHEAEQIATAAPFDPDAEVERVLRADVIIKQFPLNSMGLPWSFKKYLDEVFTAGMDGRLSTGDGRSRKAPTRNYGTGGRMACQRYMLSVTLNAPRQAFDTPDEPLFQGASLEDVLAPVHYNARFFGLSALETFAAFDVTKNPAIEDDFKRLDRHLASELGPVLEQGTG